MKELLSENHKLFESGCDFVALFFFEYVEFTACLCSQKEHEEVHYTIDSEEKSSPVFHRIYKTVAGHDYCFNFFSIISFDFHHISFNGLPLVSASQFPISEAHGAYELCGCFIYYIKNNEFFCKRLQAYRFGIIKKSLRASRKASLKRAGLGVRLKVFFMRALHTLARPFFKKEIWLIADRQDSAGDNGQAFFEYLSKNPQENVIPYFVINKDCDDYKKMKSIGRVISPRTLKFKLYSTFATRVIASQLEHDIVNPFSFSAYLRDILEKRKIVFLQHGIIKDDLSKTYNRYERQIDLFVTSTEAEYNSILENVSYGFNKIIVQLTGLARYDKLSTDTQKIVFIAPSWRKYCLESTYPVKLSDNFKESSFFKFYYELLHSKELIDTAKRTGYSLCFYPHFLLGNCKELLGELDPVFIDGENYSYNDIFKLGALLLTDYSSVQFDFAYLKKPLIYCQFDKDEFFSSHNYTPGYFSYENDGFGPLAYTLDDTVKLLCKYMENGCTLDKKYEDRILSTFKYTDNNNCERILNEVLNINEKRDIYDELYRNRALLS